MICRADCFWTSHTRLLRLKTTCLSARSFKDARAVIRAMFSRSEMTSSIWDSTRACHKSAFAMLKLTAVLFATHGCANPQLPDLTFPTTVSSQCIALLVSSPKLHTAHAQFWSAHVDFWHRESEARHRGIDLHVLAQSSKPISGHLQNQVTATSHLLRHASSLGLPVQIGTGGAREYPQSFCESWHRHCKRAFVTINPVTGLLDWCSAASNALICGRLDEFAPNGTTLCGLVGAMRSPSSRCRDLTCVPNVCV